MTTVVSTLFPSSISIIALVKMFGYNYAIKKGTKQMVTEIQAILNGLFTKVKSLKTI